MRRVNDVIFDFFLLSSLAGWEREVLFAIILEHSLSPQVHLGSEPIFGFISIRTGRPHAPTDFLHRASFRRGYWGVTESMSPHSSIFDNEAMAGFEYCPTIVCPRTSVRVRGSANDADYDLWKFQVNLLPGGEVSRLI
jgi:hypothetical protein